jgi:hypothetical protein
MVAEGLLGDEGAGLKGFGGAPALLHRPQLGFNPFREGQTTLACYALHEFLHTAIGADAESDGLLGHPGPTVKGCSGDVSRDFLQVGSAAAQA